MSARLSRRRSFNSEEEDGKMICDAEVADCDKDRHEEDEEGCAPSEDLERENGLQGVVCFDEDESDEKDGSKGGGSDEPWVHPLRECERWSARDLGSAALQLGKTYRQPLVVPQTEANEEVSKREKNETTACKVDPAKLVPSRLAMPCADDGVVDVAKTRDEGDGEKGHLEAESCPPSECVGDEASKRTAEGCAEL